MGGGGGKNHGPLCRKHKRAERIRMRAHRSSGFFVGTCRLK